MAIDNPKAPRRALPSFKPTSLPNVLAHRPKPTPPPKVLPHRPARAFDIRSVLRRNATRPAALTMQTPFCDKRVLKSYWKKSPINRTKLELLTRATTHNLNISQIAPPRREPETSEHGAQPKPLTKKVLAFQPTMVEAEALIKKFATTVFTFNPRDPGAHINPWSQLAPASYGAVSRATTKDMALLRLQYTSEYANYRLAKLTGEDSNAVLADRMNEDDVADWMVSELVDRYEKYADRRMALTKELEVLKARDLVARGKKG